ncbi:MAG: hypothetical protein H7281_14020 [Bacteriovorax sp.]|nr:hypothetical protein [Bacteriovorax sp.]
MKRINNKLFIISLFLLSASAQVYASGAKMPDIATAGDPTSNGTTPITPTPTPLPTSTPSPSPTPTPPVVTNPGGPYIEQIKTLAGNSTCANTSWAGRGKAPAGYIKGVTLSYARSLCRLKANSSLSKIMSAASSGNAAKDALAHYDSVFATLPISVAVAGQEPLRALYTLGLGLGMRESSGSFCEGYDRSAGSNRPSSAVEAGAFQTSYDSMTASPELSKLYAEYKATPERCFLDVFKQGTNCGTTSTLGSGEGAVYQKLNLSCPAFATEYAMTVLRILRGHYGPINRKEAQVIPACNQLLKSVQDLIDNDPYACKDIM